MNLTFDELTIVAPVTPPGQGGVSIIRASGKAVPKLLALHFTRLPPPRQFALAQFRTLSGQALDEGLLLYFPRPHSFTGEDVFEFQGHGSPLLVNLILSELVQNNEVRIAKRGEFSERAFLNGKLDLTQAEAISALVASRSRWEAEAAFQGLQGGLSEAVTGLFNRLLSIRQELEAYLDFFEEDLQEEGLRRLCALLHQTQKELMELTDRAQRSLRARSAMQWALVGAPNAGKSTLFNRLMRDDKALVSDLPGTTRDALRENLELEGLEIILLDTAGVRTSEDPLECLGIERTFKTMQAAEVLLWVIDASQSPRPMDLAARFLEQLESKPHYLIFNKSDAVSDPMAWEQLLPPKAQEQSRHWISAKTGCGIETLRNQMASALRKEETNSIKFLSNARHCELLCKALNALQRATLALEEGQTLDLIAEALRTSQNTLGQITGQNYDAGLLEGIFSKFCLGK